MLILGPYVDLTKEPAGDHLFYITVDDQSKAVCEDGITPLLAYHVYDISERAHVCMYIDAENNLYRFPWNTVIKSYQRGNKFSNGEWIANGAINPYSLFKQDASFQQMTKIDPTSKLSQETIAELDRKLQEVAQIANNLNDIGQITPPTNSAPAPVNEKINNKPKETDDNDQSIENAAAILEATLGKPDGGFIMAWEALKQSCTSTEQYLSTLYCVMIGNAIDDKDISVESNAKQLRSYLLTGSDNSFNEIEARKSVLSQEHERLFKKVAGFDLPTGSTMPPPRISPVITRRSSTTQPSPAPGAPSNAGVFKPQTTRRIGTMETAELLFKNIAHQLGLRS